MPHPVTTAEILAALEANAATIAEYFSSLPDAVFFDGDPDHWSPAHHLVHLTQSSESLARGLATTRPLHSTGTSRTYAEVRDWAAATLSAAPREQLLTLGRKVEVPPGSTVAGVVRAFTDASAAARAAATTWSDDALARHAMRHPLMGELTVREMLLFFVVHERHHLRGVQTRLAARDAARGR